MPEGLPKYTLGCEAVRWATKYLRHPNGPHAGERWSFIKSQADFLLWWYAVDEDGKWLYHHGARRLAKGAGKALALDTPIPTPTGWTTMGALVYGDDVLDENGDPCRVLATTSEMTGHDCYEVRFRDGSSVVADGGHLWPVGPHGETMTTREIALSHLYAKSETILTIERVDSVPVRCITVDSPSSLFLCGTGRVPTHNSPFAGLLALVELCAPVRLDYFDPNMPGGVVGKPVAMPWVQIAATAASQTANTMRMVRAFAAKGSRVAVDYRLDPGITKIYKPPNGLLEVITSSASTAEGAEISFVVMDEVEHWIPSSGGPVMAETLDRNLAKSGSRALETSNAWQPGQESVAESTYDAWVLQEEGRTRGTSKILYDAKIAPPDTDLADEASLMKGLAFAYGDCNWVDLDVLKERVWSPRTRPEVARRFYLNQPTASEESWVTPMEWAACVDTTRLVADDEAIAMFFDGSKSRDATALMGCCISDGYVFTLGVWEPDPKHDTESVVPVDAVDAAVAQAFDRFSVVAFFADVSEWEGYVKTTWPERYRDDLVVWSSPNTKESHPIAWDMRTRTYDFTMAVELCHEDITSRQLTHDGDSRVARHVINAHRRPNRWGCSIGKETKDSPKKVDAAVCVVGARMVRRLVMSSPEWAKRSEPVRSGRVFGF
jgi:hypothetical protein